MIFKIYNDFVFDDITFYADEHHAHDGYNTRTHTTARERRTAAVGARRNAESCVRRGSRIGMGEGFLRPFSTAPPTSGPGTVVSGLRRRRRGGPAADGRISPTTRQYCSRGYNSRSAASSIQYFNVRME